MNTLERANQLANTAHEQMNQGKPQQAIKTFQEAKSIYIELGDLKKAAGMQHMIGVCYKINNDLDGATKALNLAAEDYKKADSPMGPPRVMRDLGLMFINHNKYDDAEKALKQSQQDLESQPESEMKGPELGITMAKIGHLYTLQNRLDDAERYLMDGLALIRKTGHASYELTALMHFSALYFKTKDYISMLVNAEAALGIIYESDMYASQTRRLVEIYALVAEGYARSGSNEFANRFAKKTLDMLKQVEPESQKLLKKYLESEDLQAFSGLL